jgi:Arc/MetJ-type ribon-helix-helix transcriptional regulator
MSQRLVGTTVSDGALKFAAQELGLTFAPSKSSLIRMALALASGSMTVDEAKELVEPGSNLESGKVTAFVSNDLIKLTDARYNNRAFAIRVGLAMTAASRERAEEWAALTHPGYPIGRPRKNRDGGVTNAANE